MIYVNGGSYTKFGERFDKDILGLISEVIEEMEDQGLDRQQIDGVVVGNMLGLAFDHQAQLGAITGGMLGIKGKALRVEAACASGGAAIYMGTNLIKSGEAENVLVIGVEKMTDYLNSKVTEGLSTAGYSKVEAAFKIPFPASYGLWANYWMKNGWIDEEGLFYIAAKNHYQASLNDKAQFQKPIDKKIYEKSKIVAWPFRLLDCAPITDGAAAVWLSNKKGKKSIKLVNQALVNGEISAMIEANFSGIKAAQKAASQVVKGVDWKKVRVMEVHDCFTIAEALAVSDMGLVAKEKIKEFYRYYYEHKRPPKGKPFINTSGGLKACGHPVGATGVKQLVEVYWQLTNQAGRRQVEEGNLGITHNVGGVGAMVYMSLWEVI